MSEEDDKNIKASVTDLFLHQLCYFKVNVYTVTE